MFVCTLVSESASKWSLEFCTFRKKPKITSNSLLATSYKVVCSLSLTDFYH